MTVWWWLWGVGSSSYFGGCRIFNTGRMVMTEVPQGGVKMGHPFLGGTRKRWGVGMYLGSWGVGGMDFGSSRSTCLRYWGNTPPRCQWLPGWILMSCSHAKRYRSPTVPTLAFIFRWHPRRWITRDKMFQTDNVFSGGMKRLVPVRSVSNTHERWWTFPTATCFVLSSSKSQDWRYLKIQPWYKYSPAVDIVPPVSRLALPSWQTKLCRLNSFGLLLCGSEAVVSERRQILL